MSASSLQYLQLYMSTAFRQYGIGDVFAVLRSMEMIYRKDRIEMVSLPYAYEYEC